MAPSCSIELTPAERTRLLEIARSTIYSGVHGKDESGCDREGLTPALQAQRGVFVTLTINGQLRGCIGNLTATEPLASGVRRNAINAAFHDPRFAPLSISELDQIEIEISILSEPRPLKYRGSEDLLNKLRPHIDGVIIRKQAASSTFLPQVWDQLPRPQDFLTHLCIKAGLASDAWQTSQLEVSRYQVQYFEEHTAPC